MTSEKFVRQAYAMAESRTSMRGSAVTQVVSWARLLDGSR
jgi:hypothetical protein